MASITVDHTELDRCRGCGALWLDSTVLERLLDRPDAAQLDTGDPAVGKEWNAVDRVSCPRHDVPMQRLVDHEQPHVWFEQCPSCHGVLLDAGELTDLAELTLADRFRSLFAGRRS